MTRGKRGRDGLAHRLRGLRNSYLNSYPKGLSHISLTYSCSHPRYTIQSIIRPISFTHEHQAHYSFEAVGFAEHAVQLTLLSNLPSKVRFNYGRHWRRTGHLQTYISQPRIAVVRNFAAEVGPFKVCIGWTAESGAKTTCDKGRTIGIAVGAAEFGPLEQPGQKKFRRFSSLSLCK